jgi:hypothetical protein
MGGLAIVAMRYCREGFFKRMRGILKISEKLRLFQINERLFKECDGFLNTFEVELRLF